VETYHFWKKDYVLLEKLVRSLASCHQVGKLPNARCEVLMRVRQILTDNLSWPIRKKGIPVLLSGELMLRAYMGDLRPLTIMLCEAK
jgi:hypothetical protein